MGPEYAGPVPEGTEQQPRWIQIQDHINIYSTVSWKCLCIHQQDHTQSQRLTSQYVLGASTNGWCANVACSPALQWKYCPAVNTQQATFTLHWFAWENTTLTNTYI